MKLKEFISNNKLTFTVGERNSNITILCGYAIWNGDSIEDCKNAIPSPQKSGAVNQEIERVYKYAKDNHYGDFWDTEEAKNEYMF